MPPVAGTSYSAGGMHGPRSLRARRPRKLGQLPEAARMEPAHPDPFAVRADPGSQ